MILECERLVDTARSIVESTETAETKLKKERKKIFKKSTPPIRNGRRTNSKNSTR